MRMLSLVGTRLKATRIDVYDSWHADTGLSAKANIILGKVLPSTCV